MTPGQVAWNAYRRHIRRIHIVVRRWKYLTKWEKRTMEATAQAVLDRRNTFKKGTK